MRVYTELPAALGVPDVTAIRYDWSSIRRRESEGISPLETPAQIQVALTLQRTSLTINALAEKTALTPAHLRRTVIPQLLTHGWVKPTGVKSFSLAPSATFAHKRIVTVEAKLRDWRKAVGQARRQGHSSQAAYIALTERVAMNLNDHLDDIAMQGIGLISVSPTSRSVRIVSRPNVQKTTRTNLFNRAVIAERGLYFLSKGTTQGEVHPVFGWTSPHP